MRRIYLTILTMLFAFTVLAQVEVEDYYDVESRGEGIQVDVIDTGFFYQTYFLPSDSIRVWANDKRYSEIADADTKLKEWKKTTMEKLRKKPVSSPSWINNLFNVRITSWILWLLAAVFIAFILYKLVLNKGLFSGAFTRKNVVQINLTEDERFLQQDFAFLANRAEDKDDLRSAMRYNFLFTLNKLKKNGLIEFQMEKTNKKYLTELDAQYKQGFAKLARFYEYAWYGNISIDYSEYQSIKSTFQNFNNSI